MDTFEQTAGPDRVTCYYMVTLDGRLGGVVIEQGRAFLTFSPNEEPEVDTPENRATFLAVGLGWLASQGFDVDVT